MLLAILFTALVPLTPTFSVSALSAFSTLALFKLLLLLLGLEKSITSWGWRRRGPCIHGAAGILMAASDCERGCFTATENSGFVGVGVRLGFLGGFEFKEDEMMRYEGDRERKRVTDI
jgi:hypothetical protein